MFGIESTTTHAYIAMLQGNITRMASNSANCKSICVAIIAALCAMTELAGCRLLGASIFPIAILCYLDIKYLVLEKVYRDKYDMAVAQAKNGTLSIDLIFDMNPGNYHDLNIFLGCLKSRSVWPVYAGLLCVSTIITIVK